MNNIKPGWSIARFESGELTYRPGKIISGVGGNVTVEGKEYDVHVWAFEPKPTVELKNAHEDVYLRDLRN